MSAKALAARLTPAALKAARSRSKRLAANDLKMKTELIELREKSGLSQKDVGELLGITQQAVNKFERYDSDPKLSTLRQYANAVGAVVEHRVLTDAAPPVNYGITGYWEGTRHKVLTSRASRTVPKIDWALSTGTAGS